MALEGTGIRVNVLSPERISTSGHGSALVTKAMIGQLPLGRIDQAKEVVGAVSSWHWMRAAS
jgi:NAD(P)-dependent dehydrogenase (short-subunit alcohol dehydrogenase family)